MITENEDNQDPVCEEFHDEFMMSRWHEPTVMRTSVLQDPYPQGPHNERARGVRHEDVASLVPACSGARVCQEQRQRRLHWFRKAGQSNSAELVEKCPPTTRHKVRNAVTAEVKSPKSQTCDEHQPRGERPTQPGDLDGRSGSEGVQTQWPGSPWKQGLTT